MTTPYTQLFGHVARTGNVNVVLYQPPAGKRAIIRDILICSTSVGAASFNVYYSSGGANYWVARTLVSDNQPYHLELRQVLPDGASLQVNGTGDSWTCLVTGYELVESA